MIGIKMAQGSKVKSTSYYLPPRIKFALRKAAIEFSELHNKRITASMVVEKAVKQFLKLKD